MAEKNKKQKQIPNYLWVVDDSLNRVWDSRFF